MEYDKSQYKESKQTRSLSGHQCFRWSIGNQAGRKIKPDGSLGVLYYECICECGTERLISHSNLDQTIKGNAGAKSCGCLKSSKPSHNALDKEEAAFRRAFQKHRTTARAAGKEFALSQEEGLEIMKSDSCHYCGEGKKNKVKMRTGYIERYGLDRIDSSVGYVSGNVVPCCWPCNRAKSNMSVDEFLDLAKRIYEHNKT